MLEQLLKEIDEKKGLVDKARPLPEIVLDQLNEYLDIEYTYTSNAIEGNTLTRQETMLVLAKGQTIGGKSLKDHLEATNHKSSINYIKEIMDKVEPITINDINKLHAIILKGIDDRYAGKYRDVEVLIGGSQREFSKPADLEKDMLSFSKWLVEMQEDSQVHPVLFAAKAHYKLVDIHPYIDGNGRTARLLMNLILLKYGYFITIIDSEMDNRQRYYQALATADQGHMNDFEEFIAAAVSQTADIYLKFIKNG
jgi:Fic family protein